MSNKGETRTGVFVCHCGTNIAGVVDVEKVTAEARKMPDVVHSTDYKFMCSEPGQLLVKQAIAEHGLNRVVVAACSPRMHEPTFRNAAEEAGLNPYLVDMANVREHCAWVHREEKEAATVKATDLVRASVARAHHLAPLDPRFVDIEPRVLVVGGGVAGIQAALDMANAGIEVILVERQQSIGGRMAQLDKTFPTLDCSACILTPKMVSVGKHPKIKLYNYSEVEKVDGYVGSFEVTIRRKAQYVNAEKCTACGVCIEKCPKKVECEFEAGLAQRKAIYQLFPQAVPGVPVIDKESCTYFRNGKCRLCERHCEVGAIDWADEDQVVTEKVGAIILATGHALLDPHGLPEYGYGKLPNVITALEFERINNATGPTGGKIVTKEGAEPEAVAILHCIGSRDRNHCAWCSRVCCMYALKFAHLIKEKTSATVYNFYIDMRCFGKGYEEFYHRLLEEGVKMIRGKAGFVTNRPLTDEEEGKLVVVAEATTLGKTIRVPVDMVILANAMIPQPDAQQIASMFGMCAGADGFFMEKHPKLEPVNTATDGVFLAGTCVGPKDIPDAVSQGAAAASAAQSIVGAGTVKVESATAEVVEEYCTGCKMCQQMCPYTAIGFDDEKDKATLNAALCKGCGTCVATCPSGAIRGNHFTDASIFAQVSALFGG